MPQAYRFRRSRVAFAVGVMFLIFAVAYTIFVREPVFFPIFFALVGVVGLVLGRTKTIPFPAAQHASDAPAGGAPADVVILRPGRLEVRRPAGGYGTVTTQILEVRRVDLTPDGDLRATFHHLADRFNACDPDRPPLPTEEERAAFERDLRTLGEGLTPYGELVMYDVNHAEPRRVAVILARHLGCPLVDVADTRPGFQGPGALGTPYVERLRAWGPHVEAGPAPAGLRVKAARDRLRIELPPLARWVLPLLLAGTAGGVGLALTGTPIAIYLGSLLAVFGGLLLFVAILHRGAGIEVDGRHIRRLSSLAWLPTRSVPIDRLDTIRVFDRLDAGPEIAILGGGKSFQLTTPAATWCRDRIEAFLLRS